MHYYLPNVTNTCCKTKTETNAKTKELQVLAYAWWILPKDLVRIQENQVGDNAPTTILHWLPARKEQII